MQLQKWQDELAGRAIRVVAITTDSAAKNLRIAQKYKIVFPILSDPTGETLRRLKRWDERYKIASHGFFLLDGKLSVLDQRRGSWELTDEAKAYFLDKFGKGPS